MIKNYLFTAVFFLFFLFANAQKTFCGYSKRQITAASFASPNDVNKMNNYDVFFYKLDVDVENNSTYISGNVSIYAKALATFSEFVFELHDSLQIDSVIINGFRKTFSRSNSIVTVAINGTVLLNSTVKILIYYKGYAPQDKASANDNGFSNSQTLKVTWSLSESYVAYEWWPCKQVLYDKADSAEIWITTDSVNKAGSNGLLKNITDLQNGKKRYEWKTHYPIDYYLISVAVAKYFEYDVYAHPAGFGDSILIQNYIYDTAVITPLKLTPSLIEMYSKVFVMYPFALEKYGHCMAPLNGGMEHQTMTTLGPTSAYTFDIITHELAHQWFGDYVTCGSWADIWLNEGFASYCEYISNEKLATGNANSWMNSAMTYAKYAWGWVYVHDTLNTSTLFNPYASYKKGAVILHMLRYEINNDSIFYLGMKNYLNAYKYSTALSIDFQKIMEQTSGKNLGNFFNQWLYGLGYPVFSAKWNQANDIVSLLLTQTTTDASTPLFKTTVDVRFFYNGGDTLIRFWFDSSTKYYSFILKNKLVNNIAIDPNEKILNDLGTIVYDHSFNTVLNVDDAKSDLVIYPNPANDKLNLMNANGCFVEVFDISGKLVFGKQITETNSTQDISELSNGFYFIRINRNGFVSNLKFVKK